MPTAQEILEGLTLISNDALPLAVAWHMAIAATVIALARGWRPSRRVAGLLLSLPVVSVAVLSLAYGNPFNGAVFGVAALALAALATRLGTRPPPPIPPWSAAVGAALIGFGWVYPHFLVGYPEVTYLYGAPVGLVPCPTLAVTIGFAVLGGGLGSRAWPLLLAAIGAFYGGFGAIYLGVAIDAVLLAGALYLAALALRARPHTAPTLEPVT